MTDDSKDDYMLTFLLLGNRVTVADNPPREYADNSPREYVESRSMRRKKRHKPIEFNEKEKAQVLKAAFVLVLGTTPISGYWVDETKKMVLIGLIMSVLRNTYGNKMGGIKFIDVSKYINNYINEVIKDNSDHTDKENGNVS
jgi:uncharacterized membrane-anchored protein